MKYLMFVCTDAEPDTDPTSDPDIDQWLAENNASGRRVLGNMLAPATSATTVRVRHGQTLFIDGPFTESKDVIVGFVLIDCEDLDEAIEAASSHPMARVGRVEIRPLADLEL